MSPLPAAKRKALLATGTLNPHPEQVQAERFREGDFFDAHDRAQVKYEMVRSQVVDGESVAEVARRFGFSRETFYQVQRALQERGFGALLPEKRGRKGPTKLKGEILAFAMETTAQDPDLDPNQLAALIAERYGVQLHRTTVMRALKKKR